MSGSDKVWYVVAAGGQRSGPFTADQVIADIQVGRLTPQTQCWREGMATWQPLREVESFAPFLKSGGGKTALKITIWVMVLLVLAGGGLAAFLIVRGPGEIRSAEELLSQSLYRDASREIEPYVLKRPDDKRAMYLLALANTGRYATEPQKEEIFSPAPGDLPALLKEPAAILQRALPGNASLLDRAKRDFAAVSGKLSPAAPDTPQKALGLARLRLQSGLAAEKDLAKELLAKLPAGTAGSIARGADGIVVQQILTWDPDQAGPVAEMLLPGKDAAPAAVQETLNSLSYWAQQQPALKNALPEAMLSRADQFTAAGRVEQAEILLNYAAGFRPDLVSDIAKRRLTLLGKRVSEGDPAEALQMLQRSQAWPPELSPEVAKLYLDVAKRLAASGNAQGAQDAINRALPLDPTAGGSEEETWLAIETATHPDDVKLRRCQTYLNDFPDGRHRVDVLMLLVKDAAVVGAEAFLAAGETAANELLAKHAKTRELDVHVFKLAQRLAATGEPGAARAARVGAALLQTIPNTPMALEVDQAIRQWRQKMGRGSLAPELDQLADRVRKELKKFTLSTPGAVRKLMENPRAVHVVEVADGCTVDGFNSEERELLRQWVDGGGVLWVSNDVLSLFGINSKFHVVWGPNVCVPASAAEQCPVVTGCERVLVQTRGAPACNLDFAGVVPLLASGDKVTWWSLVPYGRGWISNVSPVDESSYDGARFWLNFQLFCLGWPIPGAPAPKGGAVTPSAPGKPQIGGKEGPPQSAAPTEQPTMVASPDDLAKALANLGHQRVMWIQLSDAPVNEENIKRIQQWVDEGGVLWLDTDLGRSFGFPLVNAPADRTSGTAMVTEAKHPLLEGLKAGAEVDYRLSPDRLIMTGKWETLKEKMVPLLGWEATKTKQGKTLTIGIACAARDSGRGVVIYRPREIVGTKDAARRFEANLSSFSFRIARPAQTQSAPAP